MGIVTKKGDKGKTSLFAGGFVDKDHVIVEACGTLDELCSFLGMAKSFLKNRSAKNILEDIQNDLFIVGAEVSCKAGLAGRLKKRMNSVYVARLDKIIGKLEKKNQLRKIFCLPGENSLSGVLDVARTIARRAERRVVTLSKKRMLKNPHILVYLNRLSDLLYLLARSCATK